MPGVGSLTNGDIGRKRKMLAEASLADHFVLHHNSRSKFEDDEWLLAIMFLTLSSDTSFIHSPRNNFESPSIRSCPLCGSIRNSPAIELQSVTLVRLKP